MRAVLVLVVACSSPVTTQEVGSGTGSAKPPDAARYSDDPPEDIAQPEPVDVTGPIAIELPAVPTATVQSPGQIIVAVPGGWHRVEGTPVPDAQGKLAIEHHAAISIPEITAAATAAGTLVLVDRHAKASELVPLAFALHNECWAVAAVADGKLAGMWPSCGKDPPDGPVRQLALWIDGEVVTIGQRDPTTGSSFTDVKTDLAKQLTTARGWLARPDLTYAVSPTVEVERVVTAIAEASAAGSTAARWVPPEWLPMRFPTGAGFDPIVPPPPGPLPMPIGPPVQAAVKIVVKPESVRIDVLRRMGIFRACYQKELNRNPNLVGTLSARIKISSVGQVTEARRIGGTANSTPLSDCVVANLARIPFPLQSQIMTATVELTFTH